MTAARAPLYPLTFQPILKEKVWGGRRLEALGKLLPAGDGSPPPVGESWELADLDATSASGGGGEAEHSIVAAGPLAGRNIRELIHEYGQDLMGRLETTPDGGFPILIKYLDASENLSVQVHPSADYVRQHPEAHLKSEAWYIVDAEPEAAIYKGVKEGVRREQFREAIENNTVEELLNRVPVKPGDCHYLPSGTCHALGAGVVVAEVQTPSDTTFRVYDWGRTGRELHIEQAVECIHFGPADTARFERRTHVGGMFTTMTRLVNCEYFRIEKVRMSEGYRQAIPYNQPTVWMVLAGAGTIEPGTGAEPVTFSRGQTLLIPACMEHAEVELHQDTVWLEVSFPQAMGDLLA